MNNCTILHCDLNNFYASVECVLNPQLKDKYVAVCGNKEQRHGIVLAKNQLAKLMGVATGDTIIEAQKKCPQLTIVSPHYAEYVNYAKKVQKIYKQYSDKIESFGLDESWLDVKETQKLFGDGKTIANRLRKEVKKETGLTISVGVSFCKVFAKLGSDLKKPDATTVISMENFKEILWPLPAGEMLMIGKKTIEKLRKYKIITLGDLAHAEDGLLKYVLGANGIQAKKWANGKDDTPVIKSEVNLPLKSIGHSTTTVIDINNFAQSKQIIYSLSEMISLRLRQNGFYANGIAINIRYNNLSYASKQTKLFYPSFDGNEIADSAYALLKKIWKGTEDTPLRLIGVSVFDLIEVCHNQQESIFNTNQKEKKDLLNFAVDKIRKKYGYSIMKKGINLNNNLMTDKSPIEDTEFLPFKKLK